MSSRVRSVDMLRGLTIMLMIVVNSPGSWSNVYAPLLHADWNGITPTDFVFPSFLFIVGASIVLAMHSRIKQQPVSQTFRKIAFRSAKIYAVGIFLWIWPDFDLTHVRYVGVLPRIAIVYFICASIYLFTKRSDQLKLAFALLAIYTLIMVFVPVPGIGAPDLSKPMANWANYLDSFLLPGVLWQKTWDPEGILSTVGAIGSTLLGMTAAHHFLKEEEHSKKLLRMMILGALLLACGYALSYLFPINKSLWSSSFTLITAGVSMQGWVICSLVFDRKDSPKFELAEAFGKNPIVSYALSSLLVSIFYSDFFLGVGINKLFMGQLVDIGVAPKLSSLFYALLYLGVIALPTWWLFKKKIYIKL